MKSNLMRFLRLPEVLERVGLRRSAWYQRVLDGRAPQPLKLGAKIAVWPENEIDAWQAGVLAHGERVNTYSREGRE